MSMSKKVIEALKVMLATSIEAYIKNGMDADDAVYYGNLARRIRNGNASEAELLEAISFCEVN